MPHLAVMAVTIRITSTYVQSIDMHVILLLDKMSYHPKIYIDVVIILILLQANGLLSFSSSPITLPRLICCCLSLVVSFTVP